MKIVCDFNGALRTLTTVNNVTTVANFLKNNVPGVGQPFLAFTNLSAAPVAADFSLHPDWAGYGNLVTDDTLQNVAMINAMLAAPPIDAITMP